MKRALFWCAIASTIAEAVLVIVSVVFGTLGILDHARGQWDDLAWFYATISFLGAFGPVALWMGWSLADE